MKTKGLLNRNRCDSRSGFGDGHDAKGSVRRCAAERGAAGVMGTWTSRDVSQRGRFIKPNQRSQAHLRKTNPARFRDNWGHAFWGRAFSPVLEPPKDHSLRIDPLENCVPGAPRPQTNEPLALMCSARAFNSVSSSFSSSAATASSECCIWLAPMMGSVTPGCCNGGALQLRIRQRQQRVHRGAVGAGQLDQQLRDSPGSHPGWEYNEKLLRRKARRSRRGGDQPGWQTEPSSPHIVEIHGSTVLFASLTLKNAWVGHLKLCAIYAKRFE